MKKILVAAFVLFLCIVYPLSVNAGAWVDAVLAIIGEDGTGFCWFCPIFKTLFNAMNTIATTISKQLSETFLALMGVGLLFSIGFKTAKMLTSLQAVDLMQYLTDMFRHLGRAIIATAFLLCSLSAFTYIVSPFLTMSLSLSTTIIDAGDMRGTIRTAVQLKNNADDGTADIQVASICNAYDDNALPLLRQEAADLDAGNMPEKAFDDSVLAALICMMRTISASLVSGIIIGAVFWYGGIEVIVFSLLTKFGTGIQMMILGGFIVFGHILIFAAVPFKYMDAMVRMAFVCALMPLWIVLWVFEATRGYAKKAWDMFLSTCGIFLCMSIILVLVVHLVNAAFDQDTMNDDIIPLLVADKTLDAAKKFSVTLKDLLVTIIMCFTGYKMLGTATTLASSFIGSIPNLGVGDQMAQATLKTGQLAKTTAVGAGAMARVGLNKAGAAFGKPDLGDKVAASTGRIVGHTAAAIATGGLSLPISAAMAIYDAAKNRKKGPAPVRPTFGKGGSTMGIQSYDMAWDKDASDKANAANPNKNDEDIKVFKDGAGNTVTQTYDKNTGKLKKELFEDEKGRQLEKRYDKNGKLRIEQTGYSAQATQETKDDDGKKGNHKIWRKTYNTQMQGNKKVETVRTFGEDKKLQETAVTETTRDGDGNKVLENHTVTDKDGNTTLSETTKYADDKKVHTERKEQVDDGKGGKKEKRTYTNYSYDEREKKEYREHRDGETGKKHTETITKDEKGREATIVVREGDKAQSISGKGQFIRSTEKEYYKDQPDRLKKETTRDTEDKSKKPLEEIFYERNSKILKKIKDLKNNQIVTIELQNEIEIRRS